MIGRQTALSANIIEFCRFLRSKGFVIGIGEQSAALDCLQYIDLAKTAQFIAALQAVLCKTQAQQTNFQELFNDYWRELTKAVDSKLKTMPAVKPVSKDAAFKALKTWLSGNRGEETEEVATYSATESLSEKDFSNVPQEELAELYVLIKNLSKRLASQLNRRYKAGKASLPDLRKTIRKNMRHGGELIHLVHKKPKRNRVKVVLLCDVSKSMDLYSAFLLQFMYAFQHVFARVETFTFSTSLQNITSSLKQYDYSNALQLLQSHSETWSGGTRIGESLHSFLKEYSQRLDRRTTVIILSDGWDTGPTELLEASMRTIRRKVKRIIWLNPLAGNPLYKPSVAGMQAAMPYINVFAAAHNVESLRKISRWM